MCNRYIQGAALIFMLLVTLVISAILLNLHETNLLQVKMSHNIQQQQIHSRQCYLEMDRIVNAVIENQILKHDGIINLVDFVPYALDDPTLGRYIYKITLNQIAGNASETTLVTYVSTVIPPEDLQHALS